MRNRLRAAVAVLGMAALSAVTLVPATAGATNIGNQGCTPGYWKNHTSNWQEYSPNQTLDTLFAFPDQLAEFRTKTLAEALALQGGPGVSGATQILMRASVAAFLNAAHEGLGYPYRRYSDPFNIHLQVNNALASLDRATMINLAGVLDAANNLGCPLS
jgi:hypothetical protein